jgi:hypothetical protein
VGSRWPAGGIGRKGCGLGCENNLALPRNLMRVHCEIASLLEISMSGRTRGNTVRLGTIRGNGGTLALPPDGRATHLYVCGGSGVGKSKLLEYLIRQDIKQWPESKSGLLLLDPHGSVYHNLMDWMTQNEGASLKRPVVLINLAQDQSIVGYNVLRPRDQASRSVVIDALVEAIAHVWGAANTIATPLFARWASNILTLLYENRLTLAEAAYSSAFC